MSSQGYPMFVSIRNCQVVSGLCIVRCCTLWVSRQSTQFMVSIVWMRWSNGHWIHAHVNSLLFVLELWLLRDEWWETLGSHCKLLLQNKRVRAFRKTLNLYIVLFLRLADFRWLLRSLQQTTMPTSSVTDGYLVEASVFLAAWASSTICVSISTFVDDHQVFDSDS